ncbi:hypothetical protein CLF_108561 [Clonorchis sinensis]|uniref:Uncharacterized protein n=1 Tax=Clonorchis sinensis TaxID=79923 RepID=G7YRR0_CLOSI|nr:hypothetical protein CLF_108561 [Clonorchis sinensis]
MLQVSHATTTQVTGEYILELQDIAVDRKIDYWFHEKPYFNLDNVRFGFDGWQCKPISGVAVVRPLGSTLEDIFMQITVQKTADEISKSLLYKRFVGHIFVITEHFQSVLDTLNSTHPNFRVTSECESSGCGSFTDYGSLNVLFTARSHETAEHQLSDTKLHHSGAHFELIRDVYTGSQTELHSNVKGFIEDDKFVRTVKPGCRNTLTADLKRTQASQVHHAINTDAIHGTNREDVNCYTTTHYARYKLCYSLVTEGTGRGQRVMNEFVLTVAFRTVPHNDGQPTASENVCHGQADDINGATSVYCRLTFRHKTRSTPVIRFELDVGMVRCNRFRSQWLFVGLNLSESSSFISIPFTETLPSLRSERSRGTAAAMNTLICDAGKHWTRVSLLLELISSAYPMALPGFEPRTSDMRGERVTTRLACQHPGATCVCLLRQRYISLRKTESLDSHKFLFKYATIAEAQTRRLVASGTLKSRIIAPPTEFDQLKFERRK